MKIKPLHEITPIGGGVYVGINHDLEEAIYHYCRVTCSDMITWRDSDLAECEPPLAAVQINDDDYNACEAVTKQLDFLACEDE